MLPTFMVYNIDYKALKLKNISTAGFSRSLKSACHVI